MVDEDADLGAVENLGSEHLDLWLCCREPAFDVLLDRVHLRPSFLPPDTKEAGSRPPLTAPHALDFCRAFGPEALRGTIAPVMHPLATVDAFISGLEVDHRR